MAASSASQQTSFNNTPNPSNPSPRWGRSGEPGSAFNGLSRGRGRGSSRGGRGGKPGRGGAPSRETTISLDTHSEKPVALSERSLSTDKPSSSSPAERTSASNVASRPKPPARRASRPPPVITATHSAPSGDATTPIRAQNRRKRSQTGKGLANPLPKIHVPAADDSLLPPPHRPRIGPVPHTAPIKDIPPHLASSLDVKHNIDALVEHVRAVAMSDARPSTPGSHIDWAGDEDDTLPDLDDWGVSTGGSNFTKSEMISPIIVDGLKPLPEPMIKSPPTPSGKDVALSTSIHRDSGIEEVLSQPASMTPVPPQSQFHETNPEGTKESNVVSSEPSTASAHISGSLQSNRKPLHPSLPPKPVAATANPQKLRTGATPVRTAAMSKSFIKESFATNEDKLPPAASNPNDIPEIHKESVVTGDTPQEDIPGSTVQESAEKTLSTGSQPSKIGGDDFFGDGKVRGGLWTSIHAPQPSLDSLSAPSSLTSQATSSFPPRDTPLTHTRAHTVGKPPSSSRFPRHGNFTPRGGYHNGVGHIRTQSTPPEGAMNMHRTHNTRPVITGDAISRLARTIGNSNSSVSPPKSTAVAPDID